MSIELSTNVLIQNALTTARKAIRGLELSEVEEFMYSSNKHQWIDDLLAAHKLPHGFSTTGIQLNEWAAREIERVHCHGPALPSAPHAHLDY